MRPVDQRYYRGQFRPMGDCVAACIASIFELSLNEVPNFMEMQYQRQARHLAGEWKHSWWGMVNDWAWSLGLGVNRIMYTRGKKAISRREPQHWHPGYWIAAVESRDPLTAVVLPGSTHSVVMWGEEVKHDPNPDSRAKEVPYRFRGETWFEVANPARLLKGMAATEQLPTVAVANS